MQPELISKILIANLCVSIRSFFCCNSNRKYLESDHLHTAAIGSILLSRKWEHFIQCKKFVLLKQWLRHRNLNGSVSSILRNKKGTMAYRNIMCRNVFINAAGGNSTLCALQFSANAYTYTHTHLTVWEPSTLESFSAYIRSQSAFNFASK